MFQRRKGQRRGTAVSQATLHDLTQRLAALEHAGVSSTSGQNQVRLAILQTRARNEARCVVLREGASCGRGTLRAGLSVTSVSPRTSPRAQRRKRVADGISRSSRNVSHGLRLATACNSGAFPVPVDTTAARTRACGKKCNRCRRECVLVFRSGEADRQSDCTRAEASIATAEAQQQRRRARDVGRDVVGERRSPSD